MPARMNPARMNLSGWRSDGPCGTSAPRGIDFYDKNLISFKRFWSIIALLLISLLSMLLTDRIGERAGYKWGILRYLITCSFIHLL